MPVQATIGSPQSSGREGHRTPVGTVASVDARIDNRPPIGVRTVLQKPPDSVNPIWKSSKLDEGFTTSFDIKAKAGIRDYTLYSGEYLPTHPIDEFLGQIESAVTFLAGKNSLNAEQIDQITTKLQLDQLPSDVRKKIELDAFQSTKSKAHPHDRSLGHYIEPAKAVIKNSVKAVIFRGKSK